MKEFLKRIIPAAVQDRIKPGYRALRNVKYRYLGLPSYKGETSKARPRRIREGFFDRYCRGKGLDVGYGGDLLNPNCRGFDAVHGDAQYLAEIKDAAFDFVYSSHALEHMVDPAVSLRNWWRVVKAGGYLILYIPHREFYEKRKSLPSRWNPDHKHFFLLDRDEAPDTLGIVPLIKRTLPDSEIEYAVECGEGHTITDPDIHSDGEYSIEVVIKKKGER
jgi:SAM-dependent methyltransferase